MTDQNDAPSIATPSRKPVRLRRRLGCGLALMLWFSLILSPCLCIILATQGEITVHISDVPGNSYRIWLVNEARERGIGISRPIVQSKSVDNDAVCVQTEVSFLFWQGEGKPTHYCECFERLQAGDWTLTSSSPDSCPS